MAPFVVYAVPHIVPHAVILFRQRISGVQSFAGVEPPQSWCTCAEEIARTTYPYGRVLLAGHRAVIQELLAVGRRGTDVSVEGWLLVYGGAAMDVPHLLSLRLLGEQDEARLVVAHRRAVSVVACAL